MICEDKARLRYAERPDLESFAARLNDFERALRLSRKIGFVEEGRLCEDSRADGR